MFGETPLVMVEDEDGLAQLVDRLSRSSVIAVDTESDSFHHYQEKVCLIQFSDEDQDYILDTIKLKDLSSLRPVMADPNIVKILHGADYDVVCLKRDFELEIRNLFDTLVAAQLLGLDKVGLADLLDRYFGVTVDKQFQRHDWAKRPLLTEHLEYARGDTHFLLALRELLLWQLEAADRVEHHREECALLEKREWAGATEFDNDGYLRMKRANTLDDTGKRVLKRLWIYRDQQARALDRPAFKVFPDSAMISMAAKRPESMSELEKLFPRKKAMKRRHGKAFLTAIEKGSKDDFAIPRTPKKRKRRAKPAPKTKARLSGRAAERVFNELKNWRNDLVENDGLTPFTVASNTTLKSIARRRPYSLEELASVEDVRNWQVKDHGEAILAVLDEYAPDEDDD